MKFTISSVIFGLSLASTTFGMAQISANCPAGSDPCPEDGAILCSDDGGSFSVCNQGCATFMGSVADGTRCALGSIMAAPTVQSVSEAAGMGNTIDQDAWDKLVRGELQDSAEKVVLISGKGFELSIGEGEMTGNVTTIAGRRLMPRKSKRCPVVYINGYGPFASGCN